MIKTKKENIIFIGDIHGEFKTMQFLIDQKYQIENSLLIQLGDFGVGFYKKNYYKKIFSYLNTKLKNKNNELIAFRGNHDNPDYFTSIKEYSNILLAKDFEIIETIYGNILLIGGGLSIDKKNRNNNDYWENEGIKELPKNMYNININYICSHMAPIDSFPFIRNNIDEDLLKEDYVMRIYLKNAYNILNKNNNIKKWFHGHYHKSEKTKINNTEIFSLAINEFKML